MPDQSRHRSLTFTGCWTCKARKIRCDERPVSCGNCAKKGIDCGGYDIKLQWVSNPYDQPATPNSQGRRTIKLDRMIGQKYQIMDIDRYIQAIDNDAACGISSQKGPFSIFPAYIGNQVHVTVAAGTPSPTCSESTGGTDERQLVPSEGQLRGSAASASGVMSQTVLVEAPEIILSPASPFPMPHDYLNDATAAISEMASTAERPSMALESSLAEHDTLSNSIFNSPSSTNTCLLLPGGNDLQDAAIFTSPQIVLAHAEFQRLSTQQLQGNIFGDIEVSELMHHYQFHVAYLLQPVLHPQNPYHSLYIPAALQGAWSFRSDPLGDKGDIYSALYHALLACSAFHLWHCDKMQTRYQKLGIKHKCRALFYLQATINSSYPATEHRLLLMVMLCLLSIGILSGDDDFVTHLRGAIQLRSLRKRWRITSSQTRQLNEISAFLALLARTTNFNSFPSLCMNSEGDSVIQFANSFEYMYGVTPSIVMAIEETCRLAEILTSWNNNSEHHPIPDDILQSCEDLGERLLSWSLEAEKPAIISTADEEMSKIFNYHARAWHSAALIYYYQRIQGYEARDLVQEIGQVVEYMSAVEVTKSQSKTDSTNRLAPITWPMFIASCDATGLGKVRCMRWWDSVRRYGIANIEKQWVVIQEIWRRRDAMQSDNTCSASWVHLFGGLDIRLLPV